MSTEAHNKSITDLLPDTLIELFEIDTGSSLGIKRFHAGKLVAKDIVFNKLIYHSLPIEADGFESKGDGSLPRPRLVIANPDGLISDLIKREKDMVGNIFKRIRIFLKFIDAVNFPDNTNPFANPDPESKFDDDIYVFNRKVSENKYFVEFELISPLEVESYKLPARIMIANYCPWTYRGIGCKYGARPSYTGPTTALKDPETNKNIKSVDFFVKATNTSELDRAIGGIPIADSKDKRFDDPKNDWGLSGLRWAYNYNPTYISVALDTVVSAGFTQPVTLSVASISETIDPSRTLTLSDSGGLQIGTLVLTTQAKRTVTVTLAADASNGATSLDVLPVNGALKSGEIITFSGSRTFTLDADAPTTAQKLSGTTSVWGSDVAAASEGTTRTSITGNLNLTSGTSVPADATGIVGYVKGDVVAIDPKESTEVGPIQPDQTVSLFVCIQDHTSTQDPRFKKEYWVEDQCSKTLHACKMRFGDWAEEQPTKGGIPFGGFPSIEAYRYTN
jgi:lambda family phage minor tail protein L